MRPRLFVRATVVSSLLLSMVFGGVFVVFAQQRTTTAVKPGGLTVKRIFAEPSLCGRLTRGIAWAPDSKRFSYIETKGRGKVAKTQLWAMEVATGERSLLLSAEKLESVLPAPPSQQPQATGTGQQYQWAPGGDALLLEVPHALVWFYLKSQTARVL